MKGQARSFLVKERKLKAQLSLGFTLVEIMIVIAIIIILAAALLPNILRAQIISNEATAISNLRGTFTVLQIYYNDHNRSFPREFSDLSGYISQKLISGEKSGYLFNYTRDSADEFHLNANPRTHKRTGEKYFYLDETGIMRYDLTQEADENDNITE